MKTNVPSKIFEIKSVSDIKTLYQDLKNNRRLVKNWEEFSDKIGYDRTYISRVVNEHEPLTDEVKDKIKEVFINTTKNVTRSAGTENVWLHIPEGEFQQMLLEEVRQVKATVNIVKLTVAKLATALNSLALKSPIPLGSLDIEEELGKIQRLIDGESDRLLELDKKKYGVKPPGA